MAEVSHPAEAESSQARISTDERPVYEVGFHVVPTVGDEGVMAVVEKVRALLGGAEIISEQVPQKMTLAYIIERSNVGKREKYSEAYFGFIKFALDREAIPAFEDGLRADRDVLRFLLIETVREDITAAPRRAVFASDRLEGETIKKPTAPTEEKGPDVSEEELDKSLDALVA